MTEIFGWSNFNLYDCIEVLPKFYEYYKNYLMFFCKPTFNNFYINETIQDYGEKQAEVYYKNNYVTKRQKVKNKNLDEKNILWGKLLYLFHQIIFYHKL